MSPLEPRLLLTDIGFAISIFLTLGLGILVIYKQPHKTANRVFALYSLSTSIFLISHIIGINVADPELSRKILMFNMSTILTSILTAHWILALVGREKSQKKILIAFYILAFIIIGFFMVFPETFLKTSKPILYFKNYYVPGDYYYLGDLFFYTVLIYFMYHSIAGYISANIILRKRIRYVLTGVILGYLVSITLALPLYGYNIDPILASSSGFFIILMVYALIKEELWDIRLIAKQAFVYGFSIAVVGFIMAGLNYLNIYLVLNLPYFPSWIVPILSAIVAVIIGKMVWEKLKQNEEVKYEFITVVTHKFRTPLTHLKWSLENMKKEASPAQKTLMSDLEISLKRLYDLTEVLLYSAQSEKWNYEYKHQTINVRKIIDQSLEEMRPEASAKNIQIDIEGKETPLVIYDERKTSYAIQAIISNAIKYTPRNGLIKIIISTNNRFVNISFNDSGIGISKKDLPNIFSKFYRTHEARLADTEGLGIGLYMARNMIEKQGGKIWASSEGKDKGSTFFIELPIGRYK